MKKNKKKLISSKSDKPTKLRDLDHAVRQPNNKKTTKYYKA